jgi:hypothetical protein
MDEAMDEASSQMTSDRHPVVMALFTTAATATSAARALRALGVSHGRVSIVARSHDEEGLIAQAADASPGSEFEDSLPASRIGELSAHFLSAVALVMPGIGPIVADGPLAAGLAEAAGHVAGGIARILEQAGLDEGEASRWEHQIARGAVLVAAHVAPDGVERAREALHALKPEGVGQIQWKD